jgi:homoisocitrate dehydrogenase
VTTRVHTQATRLVLEAVGAPFEYVDLDAGYELFQKTGVALPDTTLQTLRQCTGSIFGAVR